MPSLFSNIGQLIDFANAPYVIPIVAQQQKWGLYNSGDATPALQAQSVVAVEVGKEFVVPTYPIEPNGFVTYDKVELPGEYRVTLAQGVNAYQRSVFLNALEAIAASMTLYDVVTPEKVYTNVTVYRYNYRREARHGVSLIIAELMVRQVMPVVTNQFSQVVNQSPNSAAVVQSPSAASPNVSGTPQPQTITPAQQGAVQASPDLTNPFDNPFAFIED